MKLHWHSLLLYLARSSSGGATPSPNTFPMTAPVNTSTTKQSSTNGAANNGLPEQIPAEFADIYRGVSEVFPFQPKSTNVDDINIDNSLTERLEKFDRPLRIKLGIDPTGSEIHLGHSTLVRKLRNFQDAGHTAVLLIGDFTARIGDPTDRAEVRKQLTEAEVKANAETYIEQVRPILDFDTPGRLEIRYNSEWLNDIDLGKMLELLSTMTLGQMLAKEGFANRYEKGTTV